ncbi:MAG: LysM peptidoglycan-binding domain-containing M23 family metallopeptidase [Candidatus Omnitrophica bacterium]|nr:LysM peptidoglycan-binding domain-containing M23 family metallopeptidase [Candidatus Omnitrophota bacterium]
MKKTQLASGFRLQAVGLRIFTRVACGLPLAAILSFMTGCATVTSMKPTLPSGVPGMYHRVARGETLWRISKRYNVDLEEISRINRISDTSYIETGQLLLIPRSSLPSPAPTYLASEDFIWPIKGRIITYFGETYNNLVNKGINIQPSGNREVRVVRSGKIVFTSDNFGGYGKTIIIDHGDGFSTVYARNAELIARAGDNVQKGTIIAKAGNSGRDNLTYLHFEIRKGYLPQNPLFYLSR